MTKVITVQFDQSGHRCAHIYWDGVEIEGLVTRKEFRVIATLVQESDAHKLFKDSHSERGASNE